MTAEDDFIVRVFDLTYLGSPEHVYRLDLDTGPRVELASPSVLRRGERTHVTLFGRNLVKGGTDQLDRVEVDVELQDTNLNEVGCT